MASFSWPGIRGRIPIWFYKGTLSQDNSIKQRKLIDKYTCVCVYRKHTYTYTYIYVSHIYICIYAYTYAYMYKCFLLCVYIHMHTPRSIPLSCATGLSLVPAPVAAALTWLQGASLDQICPPSWYCNLLGPLIKILFLLLPYGCILSKFKSNALSSAFRAGTRGSGARGRV